MWKGLKTFLSIFFILFLSFKAESQNLITTFVDPCTKATTTFTIPINGPTTIYFYGQSRQFTAADVSSGAFSSWINQVYSDYRKVSPCSVQQLSVTRNQITSQMVSNVVSSVIGSLNTSLSSGMVNSSSGGGGDDNASKGKTQSDKKKNKNENSNTINSSSTSNGGNNGNGSTNTTSSGSNSVDKSNNNQYNTTNNGGNQTNNQQNGGNGQGTANNNNPVGGSNSSSNTSSQTGDNKNLSKSDEKGETVATTVMNVDVRNDKGSDNSSSNGGGGKKSSTVKQGRSNPIIVSSDLTSAQNLDKSFTGIINVGMSQSSMTGTSSWGVTSMVWFNLKQFAINGRYSMMKINNKGTLKFVHNINLTGAYSYGNIFGFMGYSMIVNAGKWGITGGNVSGAITKTPDDKNLFISPSVTAFYTRPFSTSKKLTISPEIYLISTPVVYSSVDKITVTDRYFSAFLGSGFDFQLTRRFKLNANYKANLSTNPEFPILSFFLIGSKVNL
jgi:hypothetical protein